MSKFEAKSPRFEPPFSPEVKEAVAPTGRWRRGTGLFSDETLSRLKFLLDEAFRIPFTRIRFGIDGIIGLFPGFGDVIGGLLSLIIPIAAWVRGVPYITIVRMTANLCIGVLVGSIPILGDAFDIGWKTNARNYKLIQRHLGEPRRHTWKDWVFLLVLACIIALVFAVPILLLIWLLEWIIHP
ncbi:MAG: DUF4112 domain-containing protein [Terracidiphilus sp.]